MPLTLSDLPVELIYEIHFLSQAPALPLVSKHLYKVLKHAPPNVTAQFLSSNLNDALKCPILDARVLAQYLHIHPTPVSTITLPKRLFRYLQFGIQYNEEDDPMPLLRMLYNAAPGLVYMSSHEGYPLARATYTNHLPLVRFLLDSGANPSRKGCLALKIAIRRRDLGLLKLLVENGEQKKWPEQVMKLNASLLEMAVSWKVHDIAKWLMEEKGVKPTLNSLKFVARS